MKPMSGELSKLKSEAVMAAYEKNEDPVIDQLANNIALQVKSESSKGLSCPFSHKMAVELLGKVGMILAEEK